MKISTETLDNYIKRRNQVIWDHLNKIDLQKEIESGKVVIMEVIKR